MSNSYYTASGTPGTGAFGASSAVRSEFLLIQAAFDKLPSLGAGLANTAVIVNAGGTGFTNTTGALALGAAFATIGGFGTTLIEQAPTSLTLPATSDTLVGLATADTLTNKTLVAPVITGTVGDVLIINSTNMSGAVAQFQNSSTEFGDVGDAKTLVDISLPLGNLAVSSANDLYLKSSSGHAVILTVAGTGEVARTIANGLQVGATAFTPDGDDPNFQILGNAYKGQHWLDADSYYIGQNSNIRSIRMFSGSSASVGVELTAGATAWSALSDYRAKLDKGLFGGALDIVRGIPIHLAALRSQPENARPMFFAHEVQEGGAPYAVRGLKDAVNERGEIIYQSLQSTDPLIPVLWQAIREIDEKIAKLFA